MVTLADVAREAGVSPMTVSNVLNGRGRVGEATRARVLETSARLGYRINVAARNLRRGRTGTVVLALPDLDQPYHGQLATRLAREGARLGLRVVVEQTASRREDELGAIARSDLGLYDGVVMVATGLGATDLPPLDGGVPVVLLGERATATPVDHVGLPNVEGARAVVRHLLERGRRRIALVGVDLPALADAVEPVHDAARLRLLGYREELAAWGVPYDPALVPACRGWSTPEGELALAGLVRPAGTAGPRPDAVFALTDSLALGCLRGLADAGLRVPHDVAVAGFDDVAEARHSVPRLTTLAPDHDQVAATTMEFIAQRIARGAEAGPPRDVVSRFSVVVREST